MNYIAKQARWLTVLSVWMVMGGFPLRAQTAPPGTIFSTYLGGSNRDQGNAVAFGEGGSVWVTGLTFSSDFPGIGSPPPSFTPLYPGDTFRSLFSPDGTLLGSSLLYIPTLDVSSDIAAKGTGVYVVGTSLDLFDSMLARAFVSRVSFNTYTRFLGGFNGRGLAVATQSGEAYVTGTAFFEERGLLFNEVFVVNLGPDGQEIYYTRLFGSSSQEGRAIAVDSAGNAYVAGFTRSPDFPTVQAADGTLNGGSDAFVTKLDPSGGIIYSTFLGGSGEETAFHLALAGDGTLYVAATTSSADFLGAQGELSGPNDLFLARLSPEGEVLASTYLGGSGSETLQGFGLDAFGFLYLASSTNSTDSPLRSSGCDRQFLTKLREDFSIVVSSCLPGADVRDLAVDPSGRLALTGVPLSGFPVVNAWQPIPRGQDAFVTVLFLNALPDCSAAFASPATLWPPNGRLVPVSIRGITDPEGDPIRVTVTSLRQDEPLTKPGVPDANGVGTAGASLRADRDGKGNGRVYHVAFEASDGSSGTCAGTVTVCVPRDQGRGTACGDGGGLFSSGG